jgi:hypothetical protein
MRKVREVLRLHFDAGLSARKIALSCNIARSTVGEYINRAVDDGLEWPTRKPILTGISTPSFASTTGEAFESLDWSYDRNTVLVRKCLWTGPARRERK